MAAKSHHHDQPTRDGGGGPNEPPFDGANADGAPTAGRTGEAGEPRAAVTETESELAAERDRNLRLRAELENVRARTARELADQHRYASLALARDLLPVLDNIDRALEAAAKSHEGGALAEGVRIVRQQLVGVLERHHVSEIAALGEVFDPQFHEAILQQPSDQVASGRVMMVTQPGYQLHDRIVRPSQVIVSGGRAGAGDGPAR